MPDKITDKPSQDDTMSRYTYLPTSEPSCFTVLFTLSLLLVSLLWCRCWPAGIFLLCSLEKPDVARCLYFLFLSGWPQGY
jgi:hypothetical protein